MCKLFLLILTEQFLCHLWWTFCDGLYCHIASNCSLSVYLNIAALRHSSGKKNFWWCCKVPEKSSIFCKQESGTGNTGFSIESLCVKITSVTYKLATVLSFLPVYCAANITPKPVTGASWKHITHRGCLESAKTTKSWRYFFLHISWMISHRYSVQYAASEKSL